MVKFQDEKNLTFRKATIDDAKILFDWRNDPETRRQSINTGEIIWDKHLEWFKKSLINPNRKIMIAMFQDEEVGTIRLDIEKPYSELSWTVASSARGRGIGTKMVERAVKFFERPLKAQIKPENLASIKIAETAGFEKKNENKEISEWVLDI